MSLDAALGIASQSLLSISQNFALISNNVANADTAGYAVEQATQQSLDAGGLGLGVRSGPTQLAIDAALQAELYAQNGAAADGQTTSAALSQLQSVLGSVGQSNDLGSLMTALQNGFSALLNDPASQTQQAAVVSEAQAVTQQINALSNAYGSARQTAQDSLGTEVGSLNGDLAQVGTLSDKIIALKAQGGSTADLENQRNAVLSSISALAGTRFITLGNGDVQVFTSSGVQLPTRGGTALSIATANAGSGAYYPGGGLPGIMLDGQDVTAGMSGGQIGANITLRDQTIPTYQAEIDQFSQTLASRFDAQGLTLFSDPQGNVPQGGGTPAQSGYVGFASAITVNPAIVANPALVRDGTHAVAGSPGGASAFTPNPNNLPGFTDMIDRVLNFALGSQVQAGVAQAPPPVSGLGPAGTLSAPFNAPATLNDFATAVTASQSADAGNAASAAQDAQATQGTLVSNLQGETGVNVDGQLSLMVQLQNAYGANARIIATVQQMYTDLMSMVQ